ncbi:hypothetical protein QCA50_016947 [Cerrena zonata]|uniref:DUF6532 domain-containing protein n=1 Tax=Cerrena zonata TaxID=2478898 RepID=A0AAW0FHC9_9APHY
MPPRRYKSSEDGPPPAATGTRALRSTTKPVSKTAPTKRSRADTVGSSAAKSSKKGAKSQRMDDTPESSSTADTDKAVSLPTATTTRRYGTRPSNDPHPALSVGLQKRRKEDIHAEAQAKRSVKEQESIQRAQETEEQQTRELQGAEKIAVLLDKQVAEDEADTSYIEANEGVASAISRKPVGEKVIKVMSHLTWAANNELKLTSMQKMTAKEQRDVKTKGIEATIASFRKQTNLTAEQPSVSGATGKATTPNINKGLPSDWRTRVDLNSKDKPITGNTTRTQARRAQEAVDGFTDLDVTQSNPPSHRSLPGPRSRQTQVVQVSEHKSEHLARPGKAKPKSQRQKKDQESSTGNGLSFDELPDWIKKSFTTIIIPTILAHYGGEANPWDIDHGEEDLFACLLQEVIDYLHPEQHYVVNKSDSIYKQARQKVYDWRAKFKHDGTAEVSKDVKGLDKETTKAVVDDALEADGFAYFEDGNTSKPFQSKYILSVLAGHYQSIEGSLREDIIYPRGALALAILAVQVAFQSFESGSFIAGPQFNEANYLPEFQIHKENVADLLKPSVRHRFDTIISRAKSLVVPRGTRARAQHGLPKIRRAPRIHQASSPPPEPEEDEDQPPSSQFDPESEDVSLDGLMPMEEEDERD